MRLAELSAFNSARKQAVGLHLGAALCVLVAVAAMAAPDAADASAGMLPSVGAAFMLLAAGCVAVGLMAQARALALRAEQLGLPAAEDGSMQDEPAPDGWLWRRARRRSTWQQAAAGGALSALGGAAAVFACGRDVAWAPTPGTPAILAAAALIGAFVLLVLERHLAAFDALALPEAPAIAALVRVPIAVFLFCGIGCLLLYAGIGAGAYAGRLSAVLCLLVSIEMTVRAAATLFVPFPPIADARAVAVSAIAQALVLRRPRPVAATVRDLFGIDLSRSWALAFVRAALAPVLAVLVLFGWGLSGIEALRVDQRAIYERFGRPVAVFGPGLHLHLPWPLGRLRPVELGVMHDVPIVFDASDGNAASLPNRTALAGTEGQPGPAADRLWDESHPSEAAYLVASLSRGRQSFESVNIDLRVVYRVGLSDAAALAAAYASDDPQRLVQARTSRLLAHYFAHHTLLDVLGADRATVSHDIASDLQAELDAIPAGVDIMAVVVEAIHPPPGAAAAYHAVQTAQISAHTAMAEQEGYAISRTSDAQREARAQRDQAAALAHEAVVDATVRSTGFSTDRVADAASSTSFRLERRLDALTTGLAHRQLLIIDHRLRGTGSDEPILDLRPSGGSPNGVVLPPPPPEQAP